MTKITGAQCRKMTKKYTTNETDGRIQTDGQTDRLVPVYPHLLVGEGYKNNLKYSNTYLGKFCMTPAPNYCLAGIIGCVNLWRNI